MKTNKLKSIMLLIGIFFSVGMSAFEVDGIAYEITSNTDMTVQVISKSGGYSGDVVIPEEIIYNDKKYTVTAIKSASTSSLGVFYNNTEMTSISLPKTLTSIGLFAFSGCTGLTSVVISDLSAWCRVSFSGFDGNPLYYAKHLYMNGHEVKELIIPNDVTCIGNSSFSGCNGLTSITIPNGVTSIGNEAFYGCSGLTTVNIPNSVTTIGDWAFFGCSGLTSISIPSGVTFIGRSTFHNCSGLTSISIPNSVTSISSYAFYDCSGLTTVTIGNSVSSIGYEAFSGCSGLTTVTIPNSVTSIGDLAFWRCSGLTSISIPNSVTTIGESAFSNCSGLTSITIPNSVTTIGKGIFSGCSGLTSITIPNSVTSIGESSFAHCNSLTSVTIPSSVTSIGNSAFYNCSGLTTMTIPNSVTSIGKSMFYNCSSLTSITIPNSVTSIGNAAFYKCRKISDIKLPENLEYIGESAFYGCYNLTTLYLPHKLKTIGESAFYNCYQIKDLIIPNTVTSLGAKAFQFCTGLESVNIGENVVYIKENLFNGCSDIKKVISGIKEPMNMVSSVFDNSVYTNAELIVPEGCLSKYQACDGWKNFVNIKDTGGGIPYKDKLSLDKATGYTGKQVVLPIKLINESEIAGVQFKMTLPAGVSVALNSKNKLMFSKTERDADHTLSGSKAEDGSYTILLYSADSEAITGNEGSIIDVTLDIDKEMQDGTYEIKISDIVLSTTKAQKINADDVTAQLEVKSYVLGDPNNDGSIDVVDITMIANHILGNNPENFIFAAADVDADGTVDVNDIISIANIILYGSSSNAKPSMAKASNHLANNVTSNDSNGDGFTVKNVSVEKGGTVTVDFELTNAAHDFSGIQFDIDLGEGLSFATKSNGKVNVTKGARLEDEDFTLSVAKQEGNQYRALGYYTDGSVIPEKSGTLFTLTLQADDSLADGKTFNCQLDNITLSTKNNEKIQQETQTFTVTIGDATGISYLFNEDGTPAVMYDLTGKRIETPAKSGQVIIIKKDGKVVKVFKK